jgi:hypothetical protein
VSRTEPLPGACVVRMPIARSGMDYGQVHASF